MDAVDWLDVLEYSLGWLVGMAAVVKLLVWVSTWMK